ncbi:MAG: AAA family ATPase [Planctomycetota bacterium]
MKQSHALHFVTGAAGVGKSTFGRRLAAEVQAVLLDSDTVTEPVVRAGLTAAALDPEDRDSPVYKQHFRDAVYECLFQAAKANLTHLPVIVIGPFTQELRDAGWPQKIEVRFGVQPIIWFLECPDEIRRVRIERRGNPRDQAKLFDWQNHVATAPPAQPAFDVRRIDTS